MSRSRRKIEIAAVAAMVLGLSTTGAVTAIAESEPAGPAATAADPTPDNWIPNATTDNWIPNGAETVDPVSPANWIPNATPANWIP